jgi:hypothetical protein
MRQRRAGRPGSDHQEGTRQAKDICEATLPLAFAAGMLDYPMDGEAVRESRRTIRDLQKRVSDLEELLEHGVGLFAQVSEHLWEELDDHSKVLNDLVNRAYGDHPKRRTGRL